MTIYHVKKEKVPSAIFHECTDLYVVSSIVRNNYDPVDCNCIEIASMLSSTYKNLIPVEVKSFIHNGAIQQGGHVVCRVEGTNLLLDPTGDYAEYSSIVRLKHDIVPWLYVYVPGSDLYLSQNHMPMNFSGTEQVDIEGDSELDEPVTEWDILRLSSGPFYKGLRCITI